MYSPLTHSKAQFKSSIIFWRLQGLSGIGAESLEELWKKQGRSKNKPV